MFLTYRQSCNTFLIIHTILKSVNEYNYFFLKHQKVASFHT